MGINDSNLETFNKIFRMSKTKKVISQIASLLAALMMLQTLYFKFTAAPESVYIFRQATQSGVKLIWFYEQN